jgi:2'-5' RNA ligase
MAQALEFFFDEESDVAVRQLWHRLEESGVPSLATRTHRRHRPHVTFALADVIGPATRRALVDLLETLSRPRLWLYTLGTFPTPENGLLLAAVVDAELLAAHAAVHGALAGRVEGPSPYYLPRSWVPHCTLAQNIDDHQLAAGFAALHPIAPIRASVREIGITDTLTGAIDVLR